MRCGVVALACLLPQGERRQCRTRYCALTEPEGLSILTARSLLSFEYSKNRHPMVQIELSVGERFEHSHRDPSVSTLVRGAATLCVNGNSLPMPIGESIEILAGAPHVMTNTGNDIAVIACKCVQKPPV